MNTIAFPGLSLGPFKIYESFKIFGLSIHLYGLIIAIGIVLAYLFCTKIAKEYDISAETLLDVILVGLPSAIICARLYYVIFSWEAYKDDLLSIFKIWEGGIAIYGSIIGAVIGVLIYCKVKKIKPFKIFDVGAFGLLIGQAVGRWGNFVNAEAYGRETALPWRMELCDLNICVHPTFLYESLWNIAGLLFLYFFYRKKQKFDGEIFFAYIVSYGLGRFWIEAMRTDSLMLGPIKVSQLVALICVIAGLSVIIYKRRKLSKVTK